MKFIRASGADQIVTMMPSRSRRYWLRSTVPRRQSSSTRSCSDPQNSVLAIILAMSMSKPPKLTIATNESKGGTSEVTY